MTVRQCFTCRHYRQLKEKIVVRNFGQQPVSIEKELTHDVLEIITVFTTRLYGTCSHKNRQIVEALRQAAEQL